jgi:hypothetical protein
MNLVRAQELNKGYNYITNHNIFVLKHGEKGTLHGMQVD